MCASCPCREYENPHDDHRNITFSDLAAAADVMNLTLEQVRGNIDHALVDIETADPVASVMVYSQRPTVLSDVDNTVAFWAEWEINAINARFDTDYDAFSRPQMDNLPKHQRQWLQTWRSKPSSVKAVGPDFHALDTLARAAQNYNVHIGTERPAVLAAATDEWLKRFAPGLDHCPRILEGPGGKARFSQSFGPDNPLIWIDDDPQFWYYVRPGIRILVPTAPWNEDKVIPPGVTLFDDWKFVENLLGC